MGIIGEVKRTQTTVCEFEWSIPQFESLSEEYFGWFSPDFKVFGESCYLHIDPDRFQGFTPSTRQKETVRYVGIDLSIHTNQTPPLIPDVSFAIKNAAGNKDQERHDPCQMLLTGVLKYKDNRFISRDELLERASELMPSNILTVICTVRYTESVGGKSKSETSKCTHCKRILEAKAISFHEKNCCDKPVKYPQCSEVVFSWKWSDHGCQSRKKAGLKKLLVVVALVIGAACIYGFSKTPQPPLHMEGEEKLQTLEINKIGKSDVSGLQKYTTANSVQTDDTKIKKSEPPLKPVLVVTDVGSTYLHIVWITPEKPNTNTAYFSVNFRSFGAKWKEISFPDATETSCNLTSLDPGMLYQIRIKAVSFSGISEHSETATIRTSFKVVYDDSPVIPEIFVLIAIAILTLLSASSCVHAYFKIPLSTTHLNAENSNEIPSAEVQNINDDDSEISRADESEASCSNETGTIEPEEPDPFNNLPEYYGFMTDINQLLEERRAIDVTFVLETASGKTEFPVHQLILAVMSSYFADKFYGKERRKGHQIIRLTGINSEAFAKMIRFCYGYKPCLTTSEEACALFKVASMFKVISLANVCCAFFRSTGIDPRHVFSVLEISEVVEDKSLKDMCYKILEEKTREILASYELRDVTSAMVHIILSLPKLSLSSEYELIKWMFEWAEVNSKGKGPIYKSTRSYLEKLLQNMFFLSLTPEEFAMLCRDNPDFFSLAEVASISLNILLPGTKEMPEWHDKDLKFRIYTGSTA